MKKIISLFMSFLVAVVAIAQKPPQFSTESNPKWYYIAFAKGDGVVQDLGVGQKVQTAAKEIDKNEQLWMAIGNKEQFQLKNKAGHYLSFSGGRYTIAQEGINLRLVPSRSKYSGSWLIQRHGAAGYMNQWGGQGVGKELGEWTDQADEGSALYFRSSNGPKLPIFSNASQSQYYYIRFEREGACIKSFGEGQKLKTANAIGDEEELWRLVGTKDKFQIQSKKGGYIVVENNRLVLSNEPYSAGFTLVSTHNGTYAPAWELKAKGQSGNTHVNQVGGAGAGRELGFWSDNDPNNPLNFILPSDIEFPDFRVEGAKASDVQLPSPLSLWYTLPSTLMPTAANAWLEYALPIGNGQLGAGLMGGVQKDEIQFNEKTLWSGRSSDQSGNYGKYLNFGSLWAEDISGEFGNAADRAAHDYVRLLDLSNALGVVSFKSPNKDVTYKREYLASYPDQVIAIRYSASKASKLSLRFSLKSGKPGIDAATSYSGNVAQFSGSLPTVQYAAAAKIVADGGKVTTTEKGIEVRGADEVLVYLSAGTNFEANVTSYVNTSVDVAGTMQQRIDAAAQKGWASVVRDHKADFKHYFDRVSFALEGASNVLPTNELIDQYTGSSSQANSNARMLEQLYFAYGRYLSIASSRGVKLPNNLQGIWNHSSTPPWNADIHANINVQMNYWPVEVGNLSEMHVPFTDYIVRMAESPQWKSYASDAGQSIGWTCYVENNIFGGVGGFAHNYVVANAWYVSHLWQHYIYTLDEAYLEKAFPAMWTASQFWMERMIKGSDGLYECPRETSPEHGPGAENGVAHAQQIVLECLRNTLEAAQALGDKSPLTDGELARLKEYVAKTDPGLAIETYDGQWGANVNGIQTGDKILREWKYSPYTVGAKGHRHLSPLMCLYPYSQVTPGSKYFDAAVNLLRMRGDDSTGWSMGWKINLWARALDGNHAHKILYNALQHCNASSGGVFYNLFDVHPSHKFQIDGNFGACAGVMEMIMQSATGVIHLLPALPDSWPNGAMKGLKTVGNFEVDVEWAEGKPSLVIIKNRGGQRLRLKAEGLDKAHFFKNGKALENVKASAEGIVEIDSKKGDRFEVAYADDYKPTSIEEVLAEGEVKVKVEGRKLIATGGEVERVRLYTLQGVLLIDSKEASILVPEAYGDVFVVQVGTKQGEQQVKVCF